MKKDIYLSYLMGAQDISDEDLMNIHIEMVGKTPSGSRKLHIPKECIDEYKKLIREKMTAGFWNEFLNENEIYFIFKFKDNQIKEFVLSSENEKEIGNLCSVFNNQPIQDMPIVYKFLSENNFYHDFMMEHYKENLK